MGRFGLGTRNDRGERMIQFCQENNLAIANTMFQHHVRRLYTWRSPGNRYKNQIDYIMIRSRWRSSILNCKTYPGTDCGSDHQPLVMKFRLQLKNIRPPHRNTSITGEAQIKFQQDIQDRLTRDAVKIMHTQDPNKEWEDLKRIMETTTRVIQHKSSYSTRANKIWLTHRTIKTIEERKKLKEEGLNKQEARNKYRELCNKIQRECIERTRIAI